MAIIKQPGLDMQTPPAGTFGNRSGFVNKQSFSAAAVADVIYLCRIPAGVQVSPEDLVAKVLTASTATVTGDFGYELADGSAGDSTFFASGKALDAVAAYQGDSVKAAVSFDQDAYLTLTIGTAAVAKITEIEAHLEYQVVGLP